MFVDFITLVFSVMLMYHYAILTKSFPNTSKITKENNFLSQKATTKFISTIANDFSSNISFKRNRNDNKGEYQGISTNMLEIGNFLLLNLK